MKLLLYYICALLITIDSHAAASWFPGSVVLNDKQVLVGEISVESRYDIVLFRYQDKVDVYPAYKIESVRLYDADFHVNRKFISIRNPSSVFKSYQLYEIVVAGEISLLRKEEPDVIVAKEDHEALGYRYLIRYKGELSSLKKFRSRIFPKIRHIPGVEMASFIKTNKLNPNNESSAVLIIQYYNKMIGSPGEIAMN